MSDPGKTDSLDALLARPAAIPLHPCLGIEAEFTLYVDGEKRLPEDVFGNPRHLVRERMIPRAGRSWHLPSGGALYFDTGVLEVATPIIEVAPGCAPRAARSLWEQIAFLRGELNAWETKHHRKVRLEGFSTHYNISIAQNPGPPTLHPLALLLTYLLHGPLLLLCANRLSTGIGVRPRDARIEITADFCPSPELTAATAALVAGAIPAIAAWPEHDLAALARRHLPVIAGFKPRAHTSRIGYLARFDCFPFNPFTTNPNQALWQLDDGRVLSLRKMAREIVLPFRRAIRAVSDPATLRHLMAVLDGRARSLLDFPERPPRYEDVGRQIEWERRALRPLPRSRYERVIRRVLTRRPIHIGPNSYTPERMLNWYEIAFKNLQTGRRRIFTLDELAGKG